MYAAGVGLGASKGKDIGKIANDYSGYVSLAKDAVRACCFDTCRTILTDFCFRPESGMAAERLG